MGKTIFKKGKEKAIQLPESLSTLAGYHPGVISAKTWGDWDSPSAESPTSQDWLDVLYVV